MVMLFKKFLLISLVLLITPHIYSQQIPKGPPAPAKPIRTVGEAKVYYFENKNLTVANVYLYIQGVVHDIYEKKDVLVMQVGYKVAGRKATQPKTIEFSFNSYCPEMPKFKDNHKLTIYLNDKILFSGETTPRYLYYPPDRVSNESYNLLDFSYRDYQKMIKAQKITIQLGNTKIELKPETIQALRDLNQTIE